MAAKDYREPARELVDNVLFQGPTEASLWFRFPGGRVRRLPQSQVFYFRQQESEPQSIVISADLGDELRKAKLI